MADLERSMAAAPAPTTSADIDSLPSLFGRLGDDVMTLLDTKLSLLKVEVKEEATAYISDGVMMAVGGVIAAIGFALLNVAIAFAVSTLFANTSLSQPAKYALGFVVTGILYLVIGGVIVLVIKGRMTKRDPTPNRTVDELRKDKQWLKKEI
jgi:uncharacterized membrane protein YqjE